ncbi:Rrf2 family transcriptional regulator [Flavihumibacter cheonanensis]|jgi:Rrf2 family iron-sulfur cluster assembly transcriptional regulator|uniref:RrF2 family transcriptional regulator n=1 Tax=Flavihumibacter cheonanensis TaxID=1442385 RepID=UPI001EF91116|nr:Rrf2 family transcriptional regulator [Flavihumibacter cheonanensis]MCG7753801.1 Rrf2 family transcriptional regulator [Flavihumibacter cheonanensis]
MKITAQEEIGLRIMLRVANCGNESGLSIPQLSEAEGISIPYVAKLTRLLRQQGFLNSTPGNKGGYVLARPANEIIVNDLLKVLGGALFDTSFCNLHSGGMKLCTNSVDCSVRSLWKMMQLVLDELLQQLTLSDLSNSELEAQRIISRVFAPKQVV